MAAPPPISVQRHYGQLSQAKTDAVVEIVADLIVAYLKRKPEPTSVEPPEESAEAKERLDEQL